MVDGWRREHSLPAEWPAAGRTTPAEPRRRDATRTRQLLLEAALDRFARDGYALTTVRDIANDVGVNVALINRYFQSKAGLFEACLASVADVLLESTGGGHGLSQIPEIIGSRVSGARPEKGLYNALLLLLRSSGDDHAEEMRIGILRSFSESLAGVAGWAPGQPAADEVLLRAQLVMAIGLGIATLRLSGIEPLASARSDDLSRLLRQVVDSVLGSVPGDTPTPNFVDHEVDGAIYPNCRQ